MLCLRERYLHAGGNAGLIKELIMKHKVNNTVHHER
jgi:hypothetical protein